MEVEPIANISNIAHANVARGNTNEEINQDELASDSTTKVMHWL
jgi:hypothetical protein